MTDHYTISGCILVVEDDATITARVRDILTADGHTVITAVGRTEALGRITENACDVVMLEVAPPDLEGFELMKAVKSADASIEIIALIRNRLSHVAPQVLRYGGYDFLQIPDELDYRLLPMVRRALEKRALTRLNKSLTRERDNLKAQSRQGRQADKEEGLARTVAHDFRNLLSIMIGYAYLIEERLEKGHPLAALVKYIQETGNRGIALTQELVAVTRNQTLSLERMDINQVLRNLEPMVQQLLPAGVTLHLDLAASEDQVLMDRTQLEQVVMNLATNARDAMPAGGRLTISTQRVVFMSEEMSPGTLRAGIYIRLDVQDTGQGMNKETMDRIFEPFFTTKKPGKGTGIGLATVQDVVRQNGGEITVSSEPGKGSGFSIFLPVFRRIETAKG